MIYQNDLFQGFKNIKNLNMKTYIHEYLGFGSHKSKCKVYIKEEEKILIGFEDLNVGTSVTNASEQLATEIIKKENFNPKNIIFYEWYPQYDAEVSEIKYIWNENNIASNATWRFHCYEKDNPFKI